MAANEITEKQLAIRRLIVISMVGITLLSIGAYATMKKM